MTEETLINEIAQIKAILNTMLDFQRVLIESLSKKDLVNIF